VVAASSFSDFLRSFSLFGASFLLRSFAILYWCRWVFDVIFDYDDYHYFGKPYFFLSMPADYFLFRLRCFRIFGFPISSWLHFDVSLRCRRLRLMMISFLDFSMPEISPGSFSHFSDVFSRGRSFADTREDADWLIFPFISINIVKCQWLFHVCRWGVRGETFRVSFFRRDWLSPSFLMASRCRRFLLSCFFT